MPSSLASSSKQVPPDSNPELTLAKERVDAYLRMAFERFEREVDLEAACPRSNLLSTREDAEQRARSRTMGPIFPHRIKATRRSAPYQLPCRSKVSGCVDAHLPTCAE